MEEITTDYENGGQILGMHIFLQESTTPSLQWFFAVVMVAHAGMWQDS